MYILYYTIHLGGQDIDFTIHTKTIKDLFRQYDDLKRCHPNDYLRVSTLEYPDDDNIQHLLK